MVYHLPNLNFQFQNRTDELNLYLVANNIKPATTISIRRQSVGSFCRFMHISPFSCYTDYSTLEEMGFNIAKERKYLDDLCKAQTSQEVGRALGFPNEATADFRKVINGERRDNSYFLVSLAKTKQHGVVIPSWLGYISFIPEELDIVGGNVSPSSKALGETYQEFVRDTEPDLARRVELSFSETKLPSSWEKRPEDGSYKLKFGENGR